MDGKIYNPALNAGLGNKNLLSQFLTNFWSLAITIGSIALLFMLILGGIKYIMSQGDKQRVEESKDQILHAVLGFLILMAIYAIIKVLETFFGMSILNPNLPVAK